MPFYFYSPANIFSLERLKYLNRLLKNTLKVHSQSIFYKPNSPEDGAFVKHLVTYCEQSEGKNIVVSLKVLHSIKRPCPPLCEDVPFGSLRLTGTAALLHRVEEETDSCSQQQVHGLVQ